MRAVSRLLGVLGAFDSVWTGASDGDAVVKPWGEVAVVARGAGEKSASASGIGGMGADVFVEVLLRSASDGIAVSERESGRFVVVSDSYCELTGYARDELIGRTSVALGLVADHAVRSEALGGGDQGAAGVCELRMAPPR
jgi:PAS domain-containing protein